MQRGFNYVGRIASIMDADPSIISELLRLSYRQGALFHGVKRSGSPEIIGKKGVMPLTPESGMASHWTKGVYLFINPYCTPGGLGETFNSSFFRYAHVSGPVSYTAEERPVRLCLVVTDYKTLARHGIMGIEESPSTKSEPDGEATIKQSVPLGAIDIIDTIVYAPRIADHRERGKCAERNLLHALYEALKTFPNQGRGRLITRNETGLYTVEPLLQAV